MQKTDNIFNTNVPKTIVIIGSNTVISPINPINCPCSFETKHRYLETVIVETRLIGFPVKKKIVRFYFYLRSFFILIRRHGLGHLVTHKLKNLLCQNCLFPTLLGN